MFFLQKPECTKPWFHIWYLTYCLVRKLDLPTLIQKQQHIFCPKSLMIDWRRFIHLPVGHITYTLSYTVKLKSEKKCNLSAKDDKINGFFWNYYFKMELAALEVKKRKNLVDYFFHFVLSIVCSCCGHSLKIVKLPDVFAVRPPSLNQSRHKQSSFYT